LGSVWAVVVAAGQSRRMSKGINKQLLPLAGRPVLAHSLAVLEAVSCLEGFVLVVSAPDVARFHQLAKEKWGCCKLSNVVHGGDRRQDSVWEGLCALPSNTQTVLVHDGARPLVCVEQVEKVVSEAVRWGAVSLAVPVKDTIKESSPDGFVVRTLARESLWLTQTPQAFSYSLLIDAHCRARQNHTVVTDDAALVEAMGYRVKLVEGSYSNIKITTPEDLAVAEALWQIKNQS